MQRKVNSTTKRIVNRIIENWWEKLCGLQSTSYYSDNVNSPNLSHDSTLSSCSSSSEGGPTTPDAVDELSAIIPRKDILFRPPTTAVNNTLI